MPCGLQAQATAVHTAVVHNSVAIVVISCSGSTAASMPIQSAAIAKAGGDIFEVHGWCLRLSRLRHASCYIGCVPGLESACSRCRSCVCTFVDSHCAAVVNIPVMQAQGGQRRGCHGARSVDCLRELEQQPGPIADSAHAVWAAGRVATSHTGTSTVIRAQGGWQHSNW